MRRTDSIRRIRAGSVGVLATAIAMLLTACSIAQINTSSPGSGNAPINIINNITPTPTFEPVTIGAWTSNQSPQLGDNITLYALIRMQVANMTGPSTPPTSTVTVTFNYNGTTGTAQTDNKGLAAYNTTAQGQPTVPVVVSATATVNGIQLLGYTFYTILPTAPPGITPTASPTGSATPGG